MKSAFLESVRQLPAAPTCPNCTCAKAHCPGPVSRPDAEFVAMLDGFRLTGGIARAEEFALPLQVLAVGDRLAFARKVIDGRLLCFEWNQSTWLPMFQFQSRAGGEVHPGLEPVIASLRPFMSPWELAQWFAEPNVWLNEQRPSEVLAIDSAAVLKAACADRFVISG